MKRSAKTVAWYWTPTLLWMLFIFALSSRQRIAVSPTYLINFLIFKTLHMIEYAILQFLWFRSFFFTDKKASLSENLLRAFIVALLYAVTDEYHQTFVNSREGSSRDVLIDATGITIMYIYIKRNWPRLRQWII